jgi:hypothetical protein
MQKKARGRFHDPRTDYAMMERSLPLQKVPNKGNMGGERMHGNGNGARKHRRLHFLSSVQYCMTSNADNGTIFGAGVDISDSGMCMYTCYPLEKDQVIIIKSTLPVPYQTAQVKWVKECMASRYKVGLIFHS